ncbi:MAG: phosphoribosylamine--glycine ligase [Chloroflexi bacterium]|nr:phosphoribosylamine--glycine ligase [Chloroflexota bacterium]
MRVLVIGGGGREHAIVWKLARSPRSPELFAAPGNAGTAQLATNLDVRADDVEGMLAAVRANAIDLTVVGPEGPLAAGLVDRFRAEGLRVFGATQAAARIESSKSFAKQTMADAGVPTAAFAVFDDREDAAAHVRKLGLLRPGASIVVKADGLAAGKGVVVAATLEEALAAVEDAMDGKLFGEAGARVVIEECLIGQEVSVFCFTDGKRVTPLVAACDYKRIFDGDDGPNTGGMGGYSPPPWWDATLERRIRETCIQPVVDALAAAGSPYTGVLYGGLMLTDDGPRVIEFNARFGDPEAQLVLPRLENDLLDVIDAVLDERLEALDLRWSGEATVAVVLASAGYPGAYETGVPITGLDGLPGGALVFHAGAALDGERLVTSGGRVLTAVGLGATIADARRTAYATAERIDFAGEYHRGDIASFGS